MRGRSFIGLVIAVGVGIVLALAIVLRYVNARHTGNARATASPQRAAAPRDPSKPRSTPVWRADLDDGGPSEDQQYKADPLNPQLDPADAWAQVDFDEIRRALPDSMYWKMAFPTKDPELIAERQRVRDQWNVQFGKVQSNTATDEEIDAYYAEQTKLSNDYLEFLVYLADHYGNAVPRSEIGALKLAGEMHLAKLEEIPRRIAEAKERHAKHEAERQAWLAQQQQFATPVPAP
jgi:hypothetical protein